MKARRKKKSKKKILSYGEFQTGKKKGITYIYRRGMGVKKVVYSKINGKAIFEGDILLGTVKEIEARREAVVISDTDYRWPNDIVNYVFDNDFTSQNIVLQAIAHWQERTPIQFQESDGENYIRFVEDDDGCFSEVGCQGGSQDINLCPNCGLGAAIHEIGHALGLFHEQSREDRDLYVKINWENILSGHEHNFEQHISDGTDIGPYDYSSIMHYPSYAFCKKDASNNCIGATITTTKKDGNSVNMGQRNALSFSDIGAIKKIYDKFFPPTHSGSLIQSHYGSRGNFEVVVPRPKGGLAHYWRNNDSVVIHFPEDYKPGNIPWSNETVINEGIGSVEGASLIQSNFGSIGRLHVVTRKGDELLHYSRTGSGTWQGPGKFGSGVSGSPALIQSRYGVRGSFDVVVPRTNGGLAHYWRNNDVSGSPWSSETVINQGAGKFDAVSLIQSNFGNPGNLEVIARRGNVLKHYWRLPNWNWTGPITFGQNVTGIPSFILDSTGSFDVVVPRTNGGLAHYWRNNSLQSAPWSSETIINQGIGIIQSVSLIQSNYGVGSFLWPTSTKEYLEVLFRKGNKLGLYWRLPNLNWKGPVWLPSFS